MRWRPAHPPRARSRSSPGSAGSDLTNTATVSAFQTDPDPSDNTSTVVTTLNHNPTCTEVTAGDDLWPPNHKFVLRTLTGAFDIDGDAVTTTILEVTQDEPLDELGDGKTTPDARPGPAGDQVELRAERSGKGDGRVYRISFLVEDGLGGECSGTALVGVPHDQRGDPAIDSGDVYVDFPVVAVSAPAAAPSDPPAATKVDRPEVKAKPARKAEPSQAPDPTPKASTKPAASAEDADKGASSKAPGKGKPEPGDRGKSDESRGQDKSKSKGVNAS